MTSRRERTDRVLRKPLSSGFGVDVREGKALADTTFRLGVPKGVEVRVGGAKGEDEGKTMG